MRHPSVFARNEGRLDVTLTPMIDVVFLLLVFFVWTTSFQIIEYILPSQMSAQMGNAPSQLSEPLPEQDFDEVVIRILWDGQLPSWTINDTPIASLEMMQAHLQAIAQVKSDAPIILHPDRPVPLGPVIEVYDLARQQGFQRVSFAVNPS